MAHGKDPSPLFEIIHRSPKSTRRGVRVPEWMRQAEEMEQRVEAAEPTVSTNGHAGPRRWLAWWYRPVRFRLQLGVLVMCGVAVLAGVIVALFVGMEIEKRQSLDQARTYAELYNREIAPLQEREPDYGLVPPSVKRASPVPEGLTAPPRNRGAAGSADDPRVPGQNYFVLMELPRSGGAEEGRRAIEFLKGNGVDAGVLLINNGKYKLVALKAFDRVGTPGSRPPEVKTFEDRVKSLGRLWKAKHGGSWDWRDAYPEKYVPGRT